MSKPLTALATIQRGQVYWVNLDPTIGSEIKKRRPCLIVSNNTNNRHSPVVTILPITSNISKVYPFEVALLARAGGLDKPSIVQANQIRTVDTQRLSSAPLGDVLDAVTMAQVVAAIKIHLAL